MVRKRATASRMEWRKEGKEGKGRKERERLSKKYFIFSSQKVKTRVKPISRKPIKYEKKNYKR